MKIIERTCVVCKIKQDKSNMNRLVLDNGIIELQTEKKLDGRGAYICKSDKCVDALIKNKCLNRIFKKDISIAEYAKIIEKLKQA